MAFQRTEQEEQLDEIFHYLEQAFKKLEKQKDAAKVQKELKEITNRLKEAKTLIKDFEREARTDGMQARELADRKRKLVNELNTYISLKKGYSSTENARNELMGGAAGEGGAGTGNAYDGMNVQELMKDGRKQMGEQEQALNRAEKVVEDTLAIGQQTAATLHDQSNQLNKIVDDLNEIEFTMKKAGKVIADITKGIMTDRCILFLLFLVVCGVVALVVVKVIDPNKNKISEAANNLGVNATQIANQAQTAITSGVQQAVQAVQQGVTGQGTTGTPASTPTTSTTPSSGSRRLLREALLVESTQLLLALNSTSL